MTAGAARALDRLRRFRGPLLTRRLRLELPDPRRVPELVALLGDPTVVRWTLRIPAPYRPADGRAFVRRARAAHRAGTALALHVVRRSDNALVGGVGLHHLEFEDRRGEIGYWIGRPFRGEGYATEAARALIALAFDRWGLHRVEAGVFPGNVRSVRLLRKLGFRYEGRLRERLRKDGRFYDDLVYARLRGASTAPAPGRRRSAAPTR